MKGLEERRACEGDQTCAAFRARLSPGLGAIPVVAAALAATGAIFGCGDASDLARSTFSWNACDFAGAVQPFEAGKEGAANTRWGAGDASQYTVEATSRCLYQGGGGDGGVWGEQPTLAVYARLSGVPTSTPADALMDLASAGDQWLISRSAPARGACGGEPEVLGSIQTKADGGTVTVRTELHHFTTIALKSGISLYAYFVAALNGTGQDATVAQSLVTTTLQKACEEAVATTKAFFDGRPWLLDAARDGGEISDGFTSTADALSEAGLDSGPSHDASQAGLPLEDFSAQMSHAYCAKMSACCPNAASAALSDCALQADLTLSVFQELAAAGVREGRLKYDGNAAAKCLVDFSTESCQDTSKGDRPLPLVPCLDAVTPLQSVDAPCSNSLECVESYCQIARESAPISDGGLSGLCTRRVPAGTVCQDDDVCTSGVCDKKLGTCRAAVAPMACTAP